MEDFFTNELTQQNAKINSLRIVYYKCVLSPDPPFIIIFIEIFFYLYCKGNHFSLVFRANQCEKISLFLSDCLQL